MQNANFKMAFNVILCHFELETITTVTTVSGVTPCYGVTLLRFVIGKRAFSPFSP